MPDVHNAKVYRKCRVHRKSTGRKTTAKFLVAIRLGETPVSKLVYFFIPNTKVKP